MLAACAIMFAASSAFGLARVYSDGPVTGVAGWPKGMQHLVNTAHRVFGFKHNEEDVFFYTGNAADFTSFLLEYSKIDPIQKHVLIIHGGPGMAKLPWDKNGAPCDWELYGCRGMLREDVKDPTSVSLMYNLEVHFWTRGKIDLKQVTVPKNVELRMAQ